MILTPQQSRSRHTYAVEKGIVSPGKICAMCGIKQSQVVKGAMIEHHEDYQKPLETITLCCSCHQKLHIDRSRVSRIISNEQKRGGERWIK